MYIFVDTETGGLTPDYSLLTLAVIKTDYEFNELDRRLFEFHVADMRLTAQAMAINNIDVRRIIHNKDHYHDAAKYLEHDKPVIMVGWNVGFDIAFIDRYVTPYSTYNSIDLRGIFKMLYPNERSGLINAAQFFNLSTMPDHTAMADCVTTLEVAKRLRAILTASKP